MPYGHMWRYSEGRVYGPYEDTDNSSALAC